MRLLGRERERAALDRLVESARDGFGGGLVVHGEPGVGKTALLDDAVEKATTLRIVRSAGVEGETELPFAALQQLCAPILAVRERLPSPRPRGARCRVRAGSGACAESIPRGRRSSRTAIGGRPGRGLFCVIDDAHWLDRASAQALGFAARRLGVERIAIAFATRDIGSALRGVAEVHLGPLGHRDARTLLESVLPAPLDEQVLERLILNARQSPGPLGAAPWPDIFTARGWLRRTGGGPDARRDRGELLSRVDALPGDSASPGPHRGE